MRLPSNPTLLKALETWVGLEVRSPTERLKRASSVDSVIPVWFRSWSNLSLMLLVLASNVVPWMLSS